MGNKTEFETRSGREMRYKTEFEKRNGRKWETRRGKKQLFQFSTGFSRSLIVFSIWSLVISESQIIFGICIGSQISFCHNLTLQHGNQPTEQPNIEPIMISSIICLTENVEFGF